MDIRRNGKMIGGKRITSIQQFFIIIAPELKSILVYNSEPDDNRVVFLKIDIFNRIKIVFSTLAYRESKLLSVKVLIV